MFRFSSYTNINTSCITIHNVGIASLFSLKWFWVVVLFRSFKLNLKYWIECVVWLCRDYVDNLLVLTRLSRQAGHHSVCRMMIGYCFVLLVQVLSSKAYFILFPMVLVKEMDKAVLQQILNKTFCYCQTQTPKPPNPKHINLWHFIHWRFVCGIQTEYPFTWMVFGVNVE